jgi:hypothetical protein
MCNKSSVCVALYLITAIKTTVREPEFESITCGITRSSFEGNLFMLCYIYHIPYLDGAGSSCIMIDACWGRKILFVIQTGVHAGEELPWGMVPMRPRRAPAYALLLYHPHDTRALSHVFIRMLAINLRNAVVRKDRMSVLRHIVNFHHLCSYLFVQYCVCVCLCEFRKWDTCWQVMSVHPYGSLISWNTRRILINCIICCVNEKLSGQFKCIFCVFQ